MMSTLLRILKNKYIEILGFHTKRKLVVIESDDWGSIRMPSKEVFEKLKNAGDFPEQDAFLRNDCLENEADLKELFKILSSVVDSKGNPAVMTANFAMANPNFEKIDIKQKKYIYEPFYKTYDRYYPQNNILKLIKEGIDLKLFFPQLHCREHLNFNRWMNDLHEGKKETLLAYENQMIGINSNFTKENPFGYMDSFNTNFLNGDELEDIIQEAKELFYQTFGFESETFVASCFVWDKQLEKVLSSVGIKGIQTGVWQNIPNKRKPFRRRIHYTGEKNFLRQVYTVRNCAYEPAYLQNSGICAESCFNEVERAFRAGKPAIINSHRFNYISSINAENASENLIGLKNVLERIIQTYKDVEFISTPELLEIIGNS